MQTGKSVGDESVSFAAPSDLKVRNSWINGSGFGQQYLRLRSRAMAGAMAL